MPSQARILPCLPPLLAASHLACPHAVSLSGFPSVLGRDPDQPQATTHHCDLVQIQTLALASCVTLGKSLHLSVP